MYDCGTGWLASLAHVLPAAVLFDMDGTLVDSESLWLMGEKTTMETLGAQWTIEDQMACLGGPLARLADYMIERSGTDLSAVQIEEMLRETMEELFANGDIPWQPGAAELLREVVAAEVPAALVTASWRSLTNSVLRSIEREFGFMPFGICVAGDEVVHGKPHPEPYLTAASALGVPIDQCIVLEDSPTGVRAGQASGAYVVGIAHMAPIDATARTTVVNSLAGVTLADLAAWMGARP